MEKVKVSKFQFDQLEKQKNKTVQEIIEWFSSREGFILHQEDIYYKGFQWVIETLKKGYELDVPEENSIIINVLELLQKQTAKGYAKYGKLVESQDLTATEWIDHASEEIIDTLVYLQAIKERLKNECRD